MTARLHIVTGKGGVGKTAVSAALAVAAARAGRRVLVCETRAHDRVANLLEVPPVGPRMREVQENLFVVDMYPEDAIHEYALLTVHFEAIYRAVFENRLVRAFLRLIPSLPELVMLGKIWYHEQERGHAGEPRFDLIVLDAPATGHALSLLRTPGAVEAAVPAGPLREHARDMRLLLADAKRTVMHLVTTGEEMPVNEAIELEQAADVLGIHLGPMVINQDVAPLVEGVLAALAPMMHEPELAGVPSALRQREGKRTVGEEHLARLSPRLRQDAVRLPRLVAPRFGLAEVRQLGERLAPWVAR